MRSWTSTVAAGEDERGRLLRLVPAMPEILASDVRVCLNSAASPERLVLDIEMGEAQTGASLRLAPRPFIPEGSPPVSAQVSMEKQL